MKVFQIAAGEPGRDYRELFFGGDVMILGPAHYGSAETGAYRDGVPGSSENQVHNFSHKPAPGDRVLLRFGKEIIGVGRIPEPPTDAYSFDETYGSVYGWDLRHTRRVKWAEGVDLAPLAGAYRKAKQKPAFSGVNEPLILEAVRKMPDSAFEGPLAEPLSVDATLYADEELGVALFRAGISNKNIADLIGALRQAQRLLSWYETDASGLGKGKGERPTENEIVSHVVLPLFLGLGWSHQQIAVEWNRVDMALFSRTPTTPENCAVVIEAKGLGRALGEVIAQPKRYAYDLGLTDARYLVTTDGASLFVYGRSAVDSRDSAVWEPVPVGFVDLRRLQKEYVLPRGVDPVKTLVGLQPGAV